VLGRCTLDLNNPAAPIGGRAIPRSNYSMRTRLGEIEGLDPADPPSSPVTTAALLFELEHIQERTTSGIRRLRDADKHLDASTGIRHQ
jgi:hypothetical protein